MSADNGCPLDDDRDELDVDIFARSLEQVIKHVRNGGVWYENMSTIYPVEYQKCELSQALIGVGLAQGHPMVKQIAYLHIEAKVMMQFLLDLATEGFILVQGDMPSPGADLPGWEDHVVSDGVLVRKDPAAFVEFRVERSKTTNFPLRLFISARWLDTQKPSSLKKVVDGYVEPPDEFGSVHMLTATNSGVSFHKVGVALGDLERGNYMPEALTAFDRIVEDLTAKKPRGRLNLLQGPPGTGKTFFIRGLLQTTSDVSFIIIPPDSVRQLVAPDGIRALVQFSQNDSRPIVLLIEDADECLGKRDMANESLVSTLLNLADGIVGSLFDIRILATTNLEELELDPAVKRPGRLGTFVKIGKLSPEVANAVLERLIPIGQEIEGGAAEVISVKPFERPVTLAEVYQRAFDAGFKPIEEKRTRVGFVSEALPDEKIEY